MTISPMLYSYPSTMSRTTRNTTIAVPSFRRLSPSIIVESLFDAPNSLRRDTTATGSVAEIIDPNKRAAENGNSSPEYPRQYYIIKADKIIEIRSIGPAIINTCGNSTLNMCQSELNALSKMSAGKNMRSNKCGSN
jgi:hypothetical protein